MSDRLAIYPDFFSFSQSYDAGQPVVVWCELHADLETPVSSAIKLLDGEDYGLLLESVQGGETRGRYSMIGLDPDLVWECKEGTTSLTARAEHLLVPEIDPKANPLESLRQILASSVFALPENVPPMCGGWVGFLGYEAASWAEKLPVHAITSQDIPDARFIRPRSMVIFDGVRGTMFLTRVVRPSAGVLAESAYHQALDALNHMMAKLRQPATHAMHMVKPDAQASALGGFSSNMTRADFYRMVEKAKAYISAGDIFQVVLSQRFSAPFAHDPMALYRALRHLNPSPFLFFLRLGDFHLVGSSPEILVRLRDGQVTIRPIAGTRPRGKTPEEDVALAEELIADPKECAEHLMLLDLGRNDVGKISKGGTVRVTEQMIIERYSHVMHIVSNVTGELAEDKDAVDAMMAGFPAGTVSGAPKIRAMEIIHELEPMRRGFYAGCVGYFAPDGSMDSCITLRTALLKDGMMHVQAGGGIVADSSPDAEFQESCNKAMALLRAASLADGF